MPVAFTQETISQQWTAALLRSAITTKLLAIGGWTQEAGTSGNEIHFSIDAPLSAAPKDRAYLKIAVEQSSATNIKIQAFAGDGYSANVVQNQWPIFSDSMGNQVNIGYGSNENFPVKICSFKSNEIGLLSVIRSDSNAGLFSVGFFFPQQKPDWWTSSLFAFTPNNGNCDKLRCPLVVPYATSYSDVQIGTDHGANNINTGGGRDLVKRLILNQSVNARNIIGQTSADIGILGAGGLAPLSQTQIDGEVWVNLNGSCSVAIRIL